MLYTYTKMSIYVNMTSKWNIRYNYNRLKVQWHQNGQIQSRLCLGIPFDSPFKTTRTGKFVECDFPVSSHKS